MSDNDLIRRGDAHELLKQCGLMGNHQDDPLTILFNEIPAVQVAVKPLEWQSTVDGAGHDHGVTLADCPVFEKRFWAERPDKQAKIDAKRAARIRSALTVTPAPDAAKVAALVEAAEARGAMPEGYCFCSTNRIGDDCKMHEPECRDLRTAIAAMKE